MNNSLILKLGRLSCLQKNYVETPINDKFSNCESAKYCEYQFNVHQNRRSLQRNIAGRVATNTKRTALPYLNPWLRKWHMTYLDICRVGRNCSRTLGIHVLMLNMYWQCGDWWDGAGVGTLRTSPRAGTSHHYSAIIGHWPSNTGGKSYSLSWF